MKPAEIRDMTDAEIRDEVDRVQEELFRLRFRDATQPLDNPSLLRELRRELARLKTIQRERELAAENA